MADRYESIYTGQEVDERLGKVNDLQQDVAGLEQAIQDLTPPTPDPEGEIYESQFDGAEIDRRLARLGELEAIVERVEQEVQDKYTFPDGGIPAEDLDEDVQASLADADTAVQPETLDDYYTKAETDALIPNVSNFITKTVNDLVYYYKKSETYTRAQVDDLISGVASVSFVVVDALPSAGAETMGKIYLIPSADPAQRNVKDEFITIDNGEGAILRYTWEQIGSTAVDLSGYATTQDLNDAVADVVRYTVQSLTAEQKAQARSNIGAAAEYFDVTYGTTTGAQIKAAYDAGKSLRLVYGDSIIAPLVIYGYTPYDPGSPGPPPSPEIPEWLLAQFAIAYGHTIYTYEFSGDTISGNWSQGIASFPEPELFIVSYGYTTQSQIADALTAGKLPVCKYNGDVYVYAGESSAGYSQFTSILYNIASRIYVKGSTWGSGNYEIYSKPSGGIPASDLAAGVIPTVPVQDVTLDDISVLDGTTAKLPAYPKSPRIFMGACSTAAATVAKEATVEAFPLDANNKPLVGTVVGIKFSSTNSATAPTLNVNSTGAASIYYNNAVYEGKGAYGGSASRYIYYVWDGTYWVFQGWSYDADADTNTIGYNLRTNMATPPVSAKTYRYRLLFTSPDHLKTIPSTTSSSTNATSARTVNQAKIDPFGPIWYYSTTTAIEANSGIGASYAWLQYSAITLGYSFNRTGAALTLTTKSPVFVKCAPQSDGSAIIDEDNPIVQALPSTADGKIYIFLGVAESATTITMYYYHPVYHFADGQIRLWTNAAASAAGVQDVTVGGTSVVDGNGTAVIPAIPDISNCVQKSQTAGLLKNDGTVDTTSYGTYSKPSGGIPSSDMAQAVQTSLGKADTAYQKPQNGIPSSDMAADVQSALALATTSIQSLSDYYNKTQVDTMLASVGSAYGVTAASLPTAGASTLGKVYYIGPTNGEYERYITTYDGSSYAWLDLGSTSLNLTDYAKQADVDALNEVLDMEEVTSTVNVEYTTTNQYIANWDPPVINNNNNYRLTNLIHFDKGDIINVSGLSTGSTAVVLVARYENGTWTKLLVGDTSQSTQSLEYIVTDDAGANIYFCWFKNATPTITKTKTATVAHRLEDLDKIDPLEDRVDALDAEAFTSIEDDLTVGYIDDTYINTEGRPASNSSFAYKVFQVRAGAKITFYTDYANPSMAALAALYVPSSPNDLWPYRVLVNGASYEAQTVEYAAPEDMTIAVSFLKSSARSIKIETSEIESNTINVNALKEDAGHGRLVQDCEFGFLFGKIAVIGDSLASGRVEGIEGQPDAVGSDYKNYSWLSHLARRWRCSDLRHYSSGGTNTASWITNWLPVMQADDVVCDAYFIALGSNNEYNETNPTGDQANYEAYISRYNQIIDAVRAKAPHAAIFLMSLYEERSGNANATLESIAETRMATDKGVYYIDYVNLAKYFRYSVPVNWRGHFSSTGYVYVASAIGKIVNEIIWDNQTEEFWQQFAKYHNGTNP